MQLSYTDAEVAFRDELRTYFARLITPDVRRDLALQAKSTMFRQIIRQLGCDGLLGLAWPKEVGGHGRSITEQFILYDEVVRSGAPFPFHAVNTVGPILMRHGTHAQRERFLPAIVAGEVQFAVGYTEPESGTDLASLTTTAERDGDQYVVNGAKLYTSGAFHADYIWLACRTSRELPRHRGISLLLVPTDAPGYSWSPIDTVADHLSCATYYTDVRVPVENLIGAENDGWRLITSQLNHERVAIAARGGNVEQALHDTIEWARSTHDPASGGRLIDVPWVQQELGRCHALVDAMRLLNWQTASAAANDTLTPAIASTTKVFGVDVAVEVHRRLLGIVGPRSAARGSHATTELLGRLELAGRFEQMSTFTGGVQEIQREIIATTGLGMPRVPR